MLALAVVTALLAAVVHVYIFVLETLRWEAEPTRRVFGTTAEEAATTRALAANQGVYNLLLAIVATVGAVLLLTARDDGAGPALVQAACGSMLVAASYLLASDRTKARAAAVQGTAPLVAVVATIVWLVA